MKIICEVSVHNRLAPHVKPRSQQSTLALGYSTPANKTPDNLFLMHFSSTNKTGTRYTLKRNLEKVFSRFLGDGKATFSMKQPPHDLHVKCEPLQLKAFLAAMKVALAGKENMDKLGLSTLAVTGVAKKALPVTKMTITRPSDYPLKGLPKTLETLTVNSIRKQSIDAQILSLSNLRVLILGDNRIHRIPKRLGDLPLVQLDLSNNWMGKAHIVDDWRWLEQPTIQKTLRNLNLSNNELRHFPNNLARLKELSILNMKNNLIEHIPFCIRRLKGLRDLNLSKNTFNSLPCVLESMHIQVLDLSDCEQFTIQPSPLGEVFEVVHAKQPPTLFQLAATCVARKRVRYGPGDLPDTVIDSLEEYPFCECGLLCRPSSQTVGMTVLKLRVQSLIKSANATSDCLYGRQVYCSQYCRYMFSSKRRYPPLRFE